MFVEVLIGAADADSISEGYSMTETTEDGSGWLWIRKHTRFVHGGFNHRRALGERIESVVSTLDLKRSLLRELPLSYTLRKNGNPLESTRDIV